MGKDRRRHGRPRLSEKPADGLPFEVTEHAVQRFRERVAALSSFARASHEVANLARTARRTDERTAAGEEVWIATDGAPIRFVVKSAERGRRICVSVLEALEEPPS